MTDYTETQELILASAKKHFLNYGFKSASLRKIVSDAGFALGAYYGHYKAKEDLFCTLLDKTVQGLSSILIASPITRYLGESSNAISAS